MQVPAPTSVPSKNPLSDLSTVLEEARIKNGIPGMSVGILHKGQIIFAEGFGKRNEHQPFTPEVIHSSIRRNKRTKKGE